MTTSSSGDNSGYRNNTGEKKAYRQKRESTKKGTFQKDGFQKTEKTEYRGTGNHRSSGESRNSRGSHGNNGDYHDNSYHDNLSRRNAHGGSGRGFRPYDRDKANDGSGARRDNRQKGMQNRDSKVKEQQPDKIEIKNRFEKEKKAMKKKQTERKSAGRSSRQQSKPKRMGNVDWTKAYENDSYDDDDFDMYL